MSSAASRIVLLPDRRPGDNPAVRRLRLARVNPLATRALGPGRFDHLKRTYD